jgi:hypothetical protein
MKMNKNSVKDLIHNKYLLYFVFIISFFNILGYLSTNNYEAFVLFCFIAFLTNLITKNMTIVLISSIFFTAILSPLIILKKTAVSTKEGLDTLKKDKKNDNDLIEKTNLETANHNTMNEGEQEEVVQNTESLDTLNKGIKGGSKKSGNYIDLASTLEESYDNLSNMLGNDGINKLTEDTKKLMNQQTELYKNMEAMTPLVGAAQKMLESFDMDSINKMMNMAGGLNIGTKK